MYFTTCLFPLNAAIAAWFKGKCLKASSFYRPGSWNYACGVQVT